MPSKKFITAVGRRKTAIATVRIIPADKNSVSVNKKTTKEYFKTDGTTMDEYSLSLCREFYQNVSQLQKSGFRGIFSDPNMSDVGSADSINTYKDSLKKFDDFCKSHSNDVDFKILEKFDVVLKNIVGNRKLPEVFFDDKEN